MRPAILERVPESVRVRLDVRADVRAGRQPFARIMAAVEGLPPDGVLNVQAPFEPVPLYRVLGRRGFTHWTERLAADDWSVWFFRAAEAAEATPDAAIPSMAAGPGTVESHPAPPGETVHVDVRGLEPPLPMVRVLEAVEALAPGQRLEVWHDRRPVFLYPQLEARGCRHATDEPEPGLVRILVWRGGAEA
jgi:uncharacterized protein (DUF2249 family)